MSAAEIGTARRAAIATPHVLATEAGVDAFRRGGNAVDAALAAAAVLCVAYPHNVTIGGDLVALVRDPGGRLRCVNATGPAPAAVDATELRERHGRQLPLRGVDVLSVPGAVAGWSTLRDLAGRLPWADVFRAAIEHAGAGVPVAPSLAAAIQHDHDDLAADPGCAAVFLPGGTPLGVGDRLRQPNLARSLAGLAADGPGALYGGPLGVDLARGLAGRGAVLHADDLAAFEPEVVEPLTGSLAGIDVHTSPPNTQGFLLLRYLRALGRRPGADPLADATPDELAAIYAEGITVREQWLADPRGTLGPEPPEQLVPAVPAGPRPLGDTIGIAAADSEGGAVSLIQSLFHAFGACVLEPGTGILMQDRACSFSLDPVSPRAIRPGARPPHTLMPVIVTERGRPRWITATMGGQAQPQIHLQVLSHLLAGAAAQAAVAAPRWTLGPPAEAMGAAHARVEADVDPNVAPALRRAGYQVTEIPARSEQVGHAQAIHVGAQPDEFDVGSDPRADGSGAIVELPPH